MRPPLYINGKCITFYSSFIFLILFVVCTQLIHMGHNHPVSILLLLVFITSFFNHGRPLEHATPVGNYAILRYVDMTFAFLLIIVTLVYYAHSYISWMGATAVAILYAYKKRVMGCYRGGDGYEGSLVHALIHVIAGVSIGLLILE